MKKLLYIFAISLFINIYAMSDIKKPKTSTPQKTTSSHKISLIQKQLENKIKLNFQGIKTKDLLQIFSKFTDKNIIVSHKITDSTNIQLNNLTWSQALDAILAQKGLSKYENNSMIFIAPFDELKNYKKQKANLETIKTESFKIKHANASNIVKLLTQKEGLLSKNGNIYADKRTNSILIHDCPSNIAILKKFIQTLDIPSKQILITAKIVNIDDAFVNELGIRLGTTKKNDYGHFDFSIAKLGKLTKLDLELAALEKEGHAKIISTPKLLTTNHHSAYIESGAEIPYQEKTSSGATNASFKKAVLSLKVTPEIIGKDMVNLHLKLNQDKVSQLTVHGNPAIDTRKIHTEVLVKNNNTVVLGGIYEWIENNNTTQQPLLSKIPILGALFRNKKNQNKKTELLIFVTPKIII